MANPTTNFGWVMPTSSSLVTNLPADFNTFGQGVDTSMAQLKGGTTGQILSKTSATDMAFTWITPNPGDITGVTAGTGISGGGTSGDVTITNSMATAMTTKGDLVPATGSGTFSRLAVGATNGMTLQVDSSTATGLKWATPSSGTTFVGCSLKKTSGAQTVADSTFVAVTFNAENFDTDAFHDNTTNASRITIPAGKAGKYLFTWNTGLITGASLSYLFVNGTAGTRYVYLPVASTYQSVASSILNLSVADYVEIYFRQTTGSTQTIYDETNGATGIANFSCQYLGA